LLEIDSRMGRTQVVVQHALLNWGQRVAVSRLHFGYPPVSEASEFSLARSNDCAVLLPRPDSAFGPPTPATPLTPTCPFFFVVRADIRPNPLTGVAWMAWSGILKLNVLADLDHLRQGRLLPAGRIAGS
jgi:hypothetical protein